VTASALSAMCSDKYRREHEARDGQADLGGPPSGSSGRSTVGPISEAFTEAPP